MTSNWLPEALAAHAKLSDSLIQGIGAEGHWIGELSSSALSTATAIVALATIDREQHAHEVQCGLAWLAKNSNLDGGWGDTIRSRSNLSTTALVYAAFGAAGSDAIFPTVIANAEAYIKRAAGSLDRLVPAVEALYGKDRTFSVPITMTLALSGRLGTDGWQRVRPLPFELAALPRGLFGALRLPVVSYALPALIAIGQVIQHHAPRFNPLRSLSRGKTLEVLTQLQPPNGGFLEATPLTSFVTMSLASMGLRDHIVARRGVEFLKASMRSDGSWPIDTNLATWVTTLAIKALRHSNSLNRVQQTRLRDWLLRQQYKEVHPYTGAAPGGWAWTDLPGGVPDADDTAGALLALNCLGVPDSKTILAAQAGVQWLLDLQNSDGGIPTFCRGWGTLPFDRSTPELTAHALRAWWAWKPNLPNGLQSRIAASTRRALDYLGRKQAQDGSWIPLWFGNEHTPSQLNPVYGTAQVLIALAEIAPCVEVPANLATSAFEFLRRSQHTDGTWGGASEIDASIEETALALEALAQVTLDDDSVRRGVSALLKRLQTVEPLVATPIGLYFAKLWYFESLYPMVFATSALGHLVSDQR